MNCPACTRLLTLMQAGNIGVEVCAGGCGGLWFDQLELKRLDEPHEEDGSSLLEVELDTTVPVDHEERRMCPSCDESVMMRTFYSPKRDIEVDHCPECGGHWLDAGELRVIRTQFASDAERHVHLNELIKVQFGDDLYAMELKREKIKGRKTATRSLFGFLFPGFR